MTETVLQIKTDTATDNICPPDVQAVGGCNESVCELEPERCETEVNPCEDDGTCDDSFTDSCVELGMVFDYETGMCVQPDAESEFGDCGPHTEYHDCKEAQLPVTGVSHLPFLPLLIAFVVMLGWRMVWLTRQ